VFHNSLDESICLVYRVVVIFDSLWSFGQQLTISGVVVRYFLEEELEDDDFNISQSTLGLI
jgi:hypothetical protein